MSLRRIGAPDSTVSFGSRIETVSWRWVTFPNIPYVADATLRTRWTTPYMYWNPPSDGNNGESFFSTALLRDWTY